MRIAYDYQIFHSQSYGGISRYFTRLAERISVSGEDVRVIAPVHRNRYLGELPRKIVSGFALKAYPDGMTGLIGIGNQWASRLLVDCWRPDIIHETYFSSSRSAPRGCATFVTVYDMIYELFPEQFPADDSTSRLKRAAVDRADHVICISENTRADLIRLFDVPPEKTSTVHLGFERLPKSDPSDHDFPQRRPFLLYVGGRRGYKNFTTFLRAVAASPVLRSSFDVLAFGGGPLSPQEGGLIDRLGLDPGRVVQLDGDDAVLGTLYEQARALVYPSVYEGFGLPLLEAMAHGCPVTTSGASAMMEVAGDAAELFAPDSVEDMRAAIERVALSDERRAALVRKGFARLECFSWSKCAAETLAIYHQALS